MESAPKALDDETQKWFYNLAGTAYFSQDSVELGVKAYELSLEIERCSSLKQLRVGTGQARIRT